MRDSSVEESTLRKVAWRLVPFICLLYVMNILDRANVGFARLKMETDLGLSEATFNLGYGMFYVGYLLFEVPSNLLLRRIGARIWISRIMVSWGVISAATMFAWDQWSFYFLRILLGIAEAGFFPGIILYLSYWFPDQQRAKMTAFFMLAIGLANVFGNPLSGWIMQSMEGQGGLHGWQWLFLVEGIPSILLGIIVFFYLTDKPRDAHWLATEQREWLIAKMDAEEAERAANHQASHLSAIFHWRVWWLIAIYFTVAVTSNAGGAYFPKLIKQLYGESSTFTIGLLSAIPHLGAVICMSLWGIHSDRQRERRRHLAGAAILGGVGWGIAAWSPSPWIGLCGLTLAQMGMMSMLPVFWTLPTAFLSGAAAAGGIALINSVANIGGFFGANILGWFGQWSMAGILIVGAVFAILLPQQKQENKYGGTLV